jgi:hypothetical protein
MDEDESGQGGGLRRACGRELLSIGDDAFKMNR